MKAFVAEDDKWSSKKARVSGLLDKRVTDSLDKIPFIGDIPILWKLFQSKNSTKQNTELIVIVTPELVRPVPAGATIPDLPVREQFLTSSPETAVRTPAVAAAPGTGGATAAKTMPVETLIQSLKPTQPMDIAGSVGGKSTGNTMAPSTPQLPMTAPVSNFPRT